MKHLMITPGYQVYWKVSPEIFTQLMTCEQWKSEGDVWNTEKTWQQQTEDAMGLEIVDSSKLVKIEPETIELSNILAENNFLTRENEALKAKLEKINLSTSTEVSTMEPL